MGSQKIAMSLFLTGGLLAAVIARSQGPEPPPFQGQGEEVPADVTVTEVSMNDDPAAASTAYFHEQLAPYGQWTTHEGLGEVWVPQVQPGWRPYTNGHWAYSDQGWAWAAEEPWGWAPFHYGRWAYMQDAGWAWTPGNVWAPAWVSWRHGGGYLGWAPLPPTAGYTEEGGLDLAPTEISPGFYTFVAEQNILAPRVVTVIVPTTRNVVIVREAHDITRYSVVNHRIVNGGVDVQRIERVTGHPVPRMSLISARGERGPFYQPEVVRHAAGATHAEFGHAFASQVEAQKKRHAQESTSGGSAGTPHRAPTGAPGRPSQPRTEDRAPVPANGPHAPHVEVAQPVRQGHPAPAGVQPQPQTQPKIQPKPQAKPEPQKPAPQKPAPAKAKSKDKDKPPS